MSSIPPPSSPVLDYENPVLATRQRRPWPRQVAFLCAAIVAFCGFLGPSASYEIRPLFILPAWMAAMTYVIARILSSRARRWAKWHMVITALVTCSLSPFIFATRPTAPSVAQDVLTYGWRNRYTSDLERAVIISLVIATTWFAVVQLADWLIRRRSRDRQA